MSLEARIAALATAVGQSLKRRGVPAGGAAGQVLAKTAAGDHQTGWRNLDPSLLPDFYTRLAVQSRGMNLVTNGTGLMQSNYNFSEFEYYPQDTFAGAASFVGRTAQSVNFLDELIPVNPNKSYRADVALKSIVQKAGANYAFGFSVSYDIDGLSIGPEHYTYDPPSLTFLTQPLKPGDTIIHVNDASGWGGRDYNWVKIHRYRNALGYEWPVQTYSRTVHRTYNGGGVRPTDTFNDSGVDKAANTISLLVPWSESARNPDDTLGAWPIGTPIGTCFPAGTFLYFMFINVPIPGEWTPFHGVIGGLGKQGQALMNQFPYGTAFIKLGFLLNYSGPGFDGTYGNATAISAVTLTEITPENITGGLPGWTGAYTAQDGRSVTAHNGIITSVAGPVVPPARGVPVGGLPGQVLTLSSSGDLIWADDQTGLDMPAGGSTGQVLTRTADGYAWATPSAGGGGNSPASISGTLASPGNLTLGNPYPAALLRRVTTTSPCVVGIYASAESRDADAARLDAAPTTAPGVSAPLVQLTTTAEMLSVAVGEAVNAATLYLRLSAAATITLFTEEA